MSNKVILFFGFLTVLTGIPSPAQSVQQFRVLELDFISDREYLHPIQDVSTSATFFSPSQAEYSIDLFWDGDRTYKARFSPTETGTWTYCTNSDDASNNGLHNQCGNFVVTEFDGENQFGIYGPLGISPDSRYFTYQNGQPFFMLVEAILEVSWKSSIQEVRAYIEDRKAKGINVAWVVPMSHQYFYPHGVRNTTGDEYFINNDHSLLNPEYFAYLDQVIQELNEAGIAVLLNPIWGRMSSTYTNSSHQYSIDLPTALTHARYIGARYAGSNVIWLLAGDAQYESEESREYWNAFGTELDRASGNTHLMTAHATGYRGSVNYFEDSKWIDFHTYTPSHSSRGSFNWLGAIQANAANTKKPVVNIEFNFEDLYDEFWNFFGDTTGVQRLTAQHVRLGAWQGILSGAVGGTSYGANGLWQWTTPETLRGFGVRHTATEALSLPGSTDMGLIKEYLTSREWYSYSPVSESDIAYISDQRVVAAADGETILAYLPANTQQVRLSTDWEGSAIDVVWRSGNSLEGTTETIPINSGTIDLVPPDEADWIVELNAAALHPSDSTNVSERTDGIVAYPNPTANQVNIEIKTSQGQTAEVIIFDSIGREVLRDRVQLSGQSTFSNYNLPQSGIYFIKCEIDSASTSDNVFRTSVVRIQ